MTSYNTIETPQDYVNYTFNISSRGVTEVMGEMAGLSNTVTTILGQLAFKTSEYLTHTESLTISMSTAAIAAYASATQEAMKFEQQIANVQAIGGESINAMDIGQAAMQYSNQFGMNISNMTEGLEALARAGLTATDVMSGVLEEGVKLSKLEGIDLEDSINNLISTTNLLAEEDYDINSQEYADAVKAMNQHIVSTSESAPINAENIIQSLQHVGGYASANKIDQDDLFAVIAQLGAKGTKGEMAGTALRAFIAAGQKDQAQRALARIGLNVSDLWDDNGEAMLPVSEMKDVLDNALEARGYSQQEKLEFYSDFAGYKQANQIMKIDTDEVKEYKETIKNAWDLGTKLDTILGTTQSNLQILFQTVKNFMTRVGSTMLPILNAIIIPIKLGVQLLDAMPFSENIVGILLGVTAIKGILLFINRVIPTLAGMYTGLSTSTGKAEENMGKTRKHIGGIVDDLRQAKDIFEHINDKTYLSQIRLQKGLMGEQSHQVHKVITREIYNDIAAKNPNVANFDDLTFTEKEVVNNIMEAYKDTDIYQNKLHAYVNRFRNMGEYIAEGLTSNQNVKTSTSKPFNDSNQDINKRISEQAKAIVDGTKKMYEKGHTIAEENIKVDYTNDRQKDIVDAILNTKDSLAEAIGRAVVQNLNVEETYVSEGLGSFQLDKVKSSKIITQLQEIEDNVSNNLGDIGYFLDYDLEKIDNLLANVGYDLQNKISAFSNTNPSYMNKMQKMRMEKIISGAAKTNLGAQYSLEQNNIDVLGVLRDGKWNDPGNDSLLGIHDKQMEAMEKALDMDIQKGVERTQRLNNIHTYLQSKYEGNKDEKIAEILQETGEIWASDIATSRPSREASKYLTDTRATFIGNTLGLNGVDWSQVENPAQELIEYFADASENAKKARQLKKADALMFSIMEQAKSEDAVFNQAESDELGYIIRRYKQLLLARNKKIEEELGVNAIVNPKHTTSNPAIKKALEGSASTYAWNRIPEINNANERVLDFLTNSDIRLDKNIPLSGFNRKGIVRINDNRTSSPQSFVNVLMHEMGHGLLQHTLRGDIARKDLSLQKELQQQGLYIPEALSVEGSKFGKPIAEYETDLLSKIVLSNMGLDTSFHDKRLEKLASIIEKDYGSLDAVNIELVEATAKSVIDNQTMLSEIISDLLKQSEHRKNFQIRDVLKTINPSYEEEYSYYNDYDFAPSFEEMKEREIQQHSKAMDYDEKKAIGKKESFSFKNVDLSIITEPLNDIKENIQKIAERIVPSTSALDLAYGSSYSNVDKDTLDRHTDALNNHAKEMRETREFNEKVFSSFINKDDDNTPKLSEPSTDNNQSYIDAKAVVVEDIDNDINDIIYDEIQDIFPETDSIYGIVYNKINESFISQLVKSITQFDDVIQKTSLYLESGTKLLLTNNQYIQDVINGFIIMGDMLKKNNDIKLLPEKIYPDFTLKNNSYGIEEQGSLLQTLDKYSPYADFIHSQNDLLQISKNITDSQLKPPVSSAIRSQIIGRLYRQSLGERQLYSEPIGPIPAQPVSKNTYAFGATKLGAYEKQYRLLANGGIYSYPIGPQQLNNPPLYPNVGITQYQKPIGPSPAITDLDKYNQYLAIEEENKRIKREQEHQAYINMQAKATEELIGITERYNKKIQRQKEVNDAIAKVRNQRYQDYKKERQALLQLAFAHDIFIEKQKPVQIKSPQGVLQAFPQSAPTGEFTILKQAQFFPGLDNNYYQFLNDIQNQKEIEEQNRKRAAALRYDAITQAEQYASTYAQLYPEYINPEYIEASQVMNQKFNPISAFVKRNQQYDTPIGPLPAIETNTPLLIDSHLNGQHERAQTALQRLQERRNQQLQDNAYTPSMGTYYAQIWDYLPHGVDPEPIKRTALEQAALIKKQNESLENQQKEFLNIANIVSEQSELEEQKKKQLEAANKSIEQAKQAYDDLLAIANSITQDIKIRYAQGETLTNGEVLALDDTEKTVNGKTVKGARSTELERNPQRVMSMMFDRFELEQSSNQRLRQPLSIIERNAYVATAMMYNSFERQNQKINSFLMMVVQLLDNIYKVQSGATLLESGEKEDFIETRLATEEDIKTKHSARTTVDIRGGVAYGGTEEDVRAQKEDWEENWEPLYKERIYWQQKAQQIKDNFINAGKSVDDFIDKKLERFSDDPAKIGDAAQKMLTFTTRLENFQDAMTKAGEIFPPFLAIAATMQGIIGVLSFITSGLATAETILTAARMINTEITQEEAKAEGKEAAWNMAQKIKKYTAGHENIQKIIDKGSRYAIKASNAIMKGADKAIGFIISNIRILGPIAAAIAIAVGALWLSEQSHAKALKEATEEQEKAISATKTSYIEYQNIHNARKAETDAMKRQQLARKESIALYRLEADRARQLNAINKKSELRNDALWGEYGIRAAMQKQGLGFIAGGDFQSQYEQYEGSTGEIRRIREDVLDGSYTSSQIQVAGWYDAHAQQLGQIEAFAPELQELYDIESRLIDKYGSQEDARDSKEFKKAVQKFADATGLNEETAKKYLDYLQTEANVENARKAMQAQVDVITAEAQANAYKIIYGDETGMGDMNGVQDAMVYATADQIFKDAYQEMWWSMLMEWLAAIWNQLTLNFGEADKHARAAGAYQDGMKKLAENQERITEEGVEIARADQRKDYGNEKYSYYEDTPFGGAIASSEAMKQDWAIEGDSRYYNASESNITASNLNIQKDVSKSLDNYYSEIPSTKENYNDINESFSKADMKTFKNFGRSFEKVSNKIPMYGNKTEIHIHNLNINTEDDPEKMATEFRRLLVDMGDQMVPRQVSRTVGKPSETSNTTQEDNQTNNNNANNNNANNNNVNNNNANPN